MSPQDTAFLANMAALTIGIGVGWAIGAIAETPPWLAWMPLVIFSGMGVFIALYG